VVSWKTGSESPFLNNKKTARNAIFKSYILALQFESGTQSRQYRLTHIPSVSASIEPLLHGRITVDRKGICNTRRMLTSLRLAHVRTSVVDTPSRRFSPDCSRSHKFGYVHRYMRTPLDNFETHDIGNPNRESAGASERNDML
jgi:hypothetical protein